MKVDARLDLLIEVGKGCLLYLLGQQVEGQQDGMKVVPASCGQRSLIRILIAQ